MQFSSRERIRLRISFSKYVLLSRFGTTSAADGLDSSKQLDDLKRKATMSYSRSMDDEYEKINQNNKSS
ncbi:hypothetical protein OROMI_026221 [Orobanche minor]